MTPKTITALVTAGFMSIALTAPLLAQDAAMSGADAIAKRQELMKSNGQTAKALSSITAMEAEGHAQTLVDNFTALMDLFPEDSQSGDTKALPAIWENKADFDAKMKNALEASKVVLAAAQSGDDAAFEEARKALGDACFACHQTYREKQQ